MPDSIAIVPFGNAALWGTDAVPVPESNFRSVAGNLFYGLDPESWVKKGLIDQLVPRGKIRGMPEADPE